MCPHKDWFSTYDPVDSSVAQCNVTGIGTIKIKTNDGAIRTLSNVRHSPDLECNLICLNNLESKGYKYSVESEFLKVSKGTRIMLKGLRQGSFYILQRSTMTGSTTASHSSPNDIFTYLCHIWSDNMTKKSLYKSLSSVKYKHPLELNEHSVCLIAFRGFAPTALYPSGFFSGVFCSCWWIWSKVEIVVFSDPNFVLHGAPDGLAMIRSKCASATASRGHHGPSMVLTTVRGDVRRQHY